MPKARRFLGHKRRENVEFPGWGALWGKLGKTRFIYLMFPFHCKSNFAICRIKKCESIICIRSFGSIVKVNQVEDKNQNRENHSGHLREGAQFNFSQKVTFISLTRDGWSLVRDPNDKMKDLSSSTNQIQFPGSSPQPAPAHILPHLFFKGQLTGPLEI